MTPLLAALILAGLVLPGVLILIRLRARRPTPESSIRASVVLGLAGASWIWLIGLWAWPAAFGPDYSVRRFVTIYANFAAALGALVIAVSNKATRRDALVIAPVLLDWIYVLVVSSAV